MLESLKHPYVWANLVLDNPRGLHWQHVGVNVMKRIVTRLQIELESEGIHVSLDDDDRTDSEPANVIVMRDNLTTLIPLRFRKRLVFVAGEPVAVAHDDGVRLLAYSVVDAVGKVLAPSD